LWLTAWPQVGRSGDLVAAVCVMSGGLRDRGTPRDN
jgi:hypothetical protein